MSSLSKRLQKGATAILSTCQLKECEKDRCEDRVLVSAPFEFSFS